jgi:hypothetical protein
MEVNTRRVETPVPQEELDPAEIHPGFEEMGREAVAEGISTLLIIRR